MKVKSDATRKNIHKCQEEKWLNTSCDITFSYPYRVKQYLSKELSDKILAEVLDKSNELTKKFNSIPKSKHRNKHTGWHKDLRYQLNVDDDSTAISTKILGHKIYVGMLKIYRKGNGQYGLKLRDKPNVHCGHFINYTEFNGIKRYPKDKLYIEFDEDKDLFCLIRYYYAEAKQNIDITRNNKSYYDKCCKKFNNAVKKLENKLINNGVRINKICNVDDGYIYEFGTFNRYIDCDGPEIC